MPPAHFSAGTVFNFKLAPCVARVIAVYYEYTYDTCHHQCHGVSEWRGQHFPPMHGQPLEHGASPRRPQSPTHWIVELAACA